MALFQVVTPVGLPSGEIADFSHWINAADLATAVACVIAWQGFLSTSAGFRGEFPALTAFGTSKVSEIDQATGTVITSAPAGTAFAGSGLGNALPPQIAVVVTLNTAILSRSTRGRYYLPATISGSVTSVGRLATTDQAALLTALTTAHSNEIAAGCTLTVYSRTHRTVENVTDISIGNVFDTQRRRRDKLVEVREGNPV